MKLRTSILALCTLASALALASNNNLKLVPGTISNGAVAKWYVNGDRPANHVLLLAKNVPTSANEAAGADIQRIAGTPVASLTGLRWTLISGTPGGGAPRWNVYYGPANGGITGYEFLEPTSYDGNGVGRVTNAQIQNPLYFVGAAPQPGDVIKYLQIIVDVQKSITLDDIGVTIGTDETVFGGPGNSN
jgi:hypothetical protein